MRRLKPLGSTIMFERRVAHEIERSGGRDRGSRRRRRRSHPAVRRQRHRRPARRDARRAGTRRAARSTVLGMPVDPGNLLMAGTLSGRTCSACRAAPARPSSMASILCSGGSLAGLPVGRRRDRGHGRGRTSGRQPCPAASARRAWLVTAPACPASARSFWRPATLPACGPPAGRRTSCSQPWRASPMVRHVVEAALASAASDVVVVTGNEKPRITTALRRSAAYRLSIILIIQKV